MESVGKFLTIENESTGLYKEKGSKFIAYAIPCKTEEVAKEHIARLRKENPQAVHVCFAWRFGVNKFTDRFSDDGEPSNSAGKPIFGQIISYDLTNVLIAVVRYYGGTNLGVGGLIQAYKTAADEALKSAKIKEKWLSAYYQAYFEIPLTGTVMQLLNKNKAIILDQGFENNLSTVNFKTRIENEERLLSSFKEHSNVELKLSRREN